MSNLFKPEDFYAVAGYKLDDACSMAADIANNKTQQLIDVIKECRSLFAYCAGPTRDVKTGKLLDGARLCSELLLKLEEQ